MEQDYLVFQKLCGIDLFTENNPAHLEKVIFHPKIQELLVIK